MALNFLQVLIFEIFFHDQRKKSSRKKQKRAKIFSAKISVTPLSKLHTDIFREDGYCKGLMHEQDVME